MNLRILIVLALLMHINAKSYSQTIQETRDWLNVMFNKYTCTTSPYSAENEKLVSPSDVCHVYYPGQLREMNYKEIKSVSYFMNPYPNSKGVVLQIIGSQKNSMWLIIGIEDDAKKIVKAIKYLAEQKGATLIKDNLFDN